ncbi:MAG: hypothetical protein IJM27_02995 [Eubacterium sp.]|nr:hypothetical protein [Eubacterium sp.]
MDWKKNRKLSGLLLGLMLAGLTGCGDGARGELVSPEVPMSYATTLKTTDVIRGNLTPEFQAKLSLVDFEQDRYGYTVDKYDQLMNQYELVMDPLEIQVGDKVKAGDVLLSFHSKALDRELQENEKAISKANLEIDHLKRLAALDPSDDHKTEIAELERQIGVSRLRIADVKETYDSLNLVAKEDGFVSVIDSMLLSGYVMPGTDLILVDRSAGYYWTEPTEQYTFQKGKRYSAETEFGNVELEVVDTPEGQQGNKVYFKPVDEENNRPTREIWLKFQLPEIKDVCYVNTLAVFKKGDKNYVYVVRDDETKRAVEVELGEQFGTYYIIKSGLEGGEKVELP